MSKTLKYCMRANLALLLIIIALNGCSILNPKKEVYRIYKDDHRRKRVFRNFFYVAEYYYVKYNELPEGKDQMEKIIDEEIRRYKDLNTILKYESLSSRIVNDTLFVIYSYGPDNEDNNCSTEIFMNENISFKEYKRLQGDIPLAKIKIPIEF